jgi:thioredoxin-like negative regulator of GroEL
VIAALEAAKVNSEGAAKPDMELLRKLSDAAVLMKSKKYDDAATTLSEALDASFARMETGFVMAELLRQRVQYEPAAAVYAQITQSQPDFPELHDKASYILYRLGNDESALNEAKTAIAGNPDDAEAAGADA